MSQASLAIANGSGAAVRTALNAALEALATLHSGPSAPSNPVPGLLWWDTSANQIKIRNAANNAWVVTASFNGTAFSAWANGGEAARASLVALLSGATFTGKVSTKASAAGGAGFRLIPGTDPSSPADGDVWVTSSAIKVRIGGTTHTLPLSGATSKYASAEQVITSAGTLSLSHGLGGIPDLVYGELVCKTAEFGYSIGDRVAIPLAHQNLGSIGSYGCTAMPKASTVDLQFGLREDVFLVNRRDPSAGNVVSLTNANWRLVVRAFRF